MGECQTVSRRLTAIPATKANRGRWRVRRLVFGLALIVSMVLVAGVAYWAGSTVLSLPQDPLSEMAGDLVYVVEDGRVGRSIAFTAAAEWQLTPAGRNSAVGTVTSVEVGQGASVGAGDILYTVDLRPVVAAHGIVPAFRDLSVRDKGPDVAQVQTLLAERGLFEGEIDGVFGSGTREAVKRWQRENGIEPDGVVRKGDVAFFGDLPARVFLAEGVELGARLIGGEETVFLVPDHPRFWLPLTVEQRSLVPLSAGVVVEFAGGVWAARIERVLESAETGQLDLILVGEDSESVCADDCVLWVDLGSRTDFSASIVIVPETAGPVVPVAAIFTDPGNQAYVTLEDGSLREVEIVQSANGLAVVDGVAPGTSILLPGRGAE